MYSLPEPRRRERTDQNRRVRITATRSAIKRSSNGILQERTCTFDSYYRSVPPGVGRHELAFTEYSFIARIGCTSQ